jgi:hypothetical protein
MTFVALCFHYLEWFCRPYQSTLRHTVFPSGTDRADTLVAMALRLDTGIPVSVSVSNNPFLGSGHRLGFYGDQGTLMLINSTTDYISGFQLLYGSRDMGQLAVIGQADNHPCEDINQFG